MKTKTLLSMIALMLGISAFSQKNTIQLTFTAVKDSIYQPLNLIKVMNRTQGTQTIIYWPDTSVSIEINPGDLMLYVGFAELIDAVRETDRENGQFQLFQNYPNPVTDESFFSVRIPEKGTVNLMVTDIQGRTVFSGDRQLDKGRHSFRFMPGDGYLYFLSARMNGQVQTIKIISTAASAGKACTLEYMGPVNDKLPLKESAATTTDLVQSGILDSPETDESYTFQFASDIPCPGTPTVEYEGQVYNTVQIFSQCWLKENLNVGTMIPGYQNQTNNGTIEKYCYNNEPDSCTNKGGLYQWNEMMQYTNQAGTQGICPEGWHLPTHEEWKVLEGAADSFYDIGDPQWDMNEGRGFDAGTNLKSESGWSNGTDKYGFSGLTGGWRDAFDYTFAIGDWGLLWTSSTSIDGQWGRYRVLVPGWEGVYAAGCNKAYGFSVRCIKDE